MYVYRWPNVVWSRHEDYVAVKALGPILGRGTPLQIAFLAEPSPSLNHAVSVLQSAGVTVWLAELLLISM
jgi:hypothetical protein